MSSKSHKGSKGFNQKNNRSSHKDDRFYKDEFPTHKGEKPKRSKGKTRRETEVDGFDLMG